MKREISCSIVVASMLMTACGLLGAQSIESQLAGYKTAMTEFMWQKHPESQERLGAACGVLRRRLKVDPGARDVVAAEIQDYARKKYVTDDPSAAPKKSSQNKVEDFVYTYNLMKILSGANPQSFISLAKDILSDQAASKRYKRLVFEQLLGERFTISVTQPENLPAYDKSILELGLQFVAPSDCLRFTFGDRLLFKSFVVHLIGYHQPPLWLPPVDRERGLQIAWRFIRSERHSFLENVTFLGQIIEADPAIRSYYIEQLKGYAEDPRTAPTVRLEFARRLVSLGEMTERELGCVQQEIEQDKARKKPSESP